MRKFIDQIEECDVHIDGSLPFRNYVVLEPTNDCSANCVHCFHKNSNKYSWNKNQIDKYLDLLQENGINAECISPKDFAERKDIIQALIDTLDKYKLDLIVLAGFLVVLPPEMISKYRNKIINIHPSLIPSFCGNGFYGLKVHE